MNGRFSDLAHDGVPGTRGRLVPVGLALAVPALVLALLTVDKTIRKFVLHEWKTYQRENLLHRLHIVALHLQANI